MEISITITRKLVPAPGMQPAELAGVLHSELLARLKAEDGLVLGAVVLKHPADFLQLGAQVHVQQKHRHAHRAADEVQGQLVGDEQLAQRLNPRGRAKNSATDRMMARITAHRIITSSGFMCSALASFFSKALGSSAWLPAISADSASVFMP